MAERSLLYTDVKLQKAPHRSMEPMKYLFVGAGL